MLHTHPISTKSFETNLSLDDPRDRVAGSAWDRRRRSVQEGTGQRFGCGQTSRRGRPTLHAGEAGPPRRSRRRRRVQLLHDVAQDVVVLDFRLLLWVGVANRVRHPLFSSGLDKRICH